MILVLILVRCAALVIRIRRPAESQPSPGRDDRLCWGQFEQSLTLSKPPWRRRRSPAGRSPLASWRGWRRLSSRVAAHWQLRRRLHLLFDQVPGRRDRKAKHSGHMSPWSQTSALS